MEGANSDLGGVIWMYLEVSTCVLESDMLGFHASFDLDVILKSCIS